MNRSQLIVVSFCATLGIGIYLFASIKKPQKEKTAEAEQNESQQKADVEPLNIEEYIAEVNSMVSDKTVREKIELLEKSGSYKSLAQEYQKIDKPLAVAYYSVKDAEKENSVKAFVGAGDYNSMLMQSAPDAKARNFLSNNALKCYQKAVDLDSTNTDNRIRLAGAYMASGSAPMQGISILLDLVRKDSTNVNALLMLGRFGIESGQYDKAIARLEKILYLRPQNSEALFLLAEAYSRQGNKAKAIEMLERCKETVLEQDAKKEIESYIQELRKAEK